MLRRERPLLEQAMADLSGCWEWGVKVFLSPDMAAGGGGPAGDGEPDGGAVPLDADGDTGAATRAEDRGTQYMARRRAERDRREAAERRAAETGERIHAQLTRFAHDARSTPPQPPEASGHPGLMVLNGVYLIDRVRTDGFHALVESLHERHSGDGIELVTSGPWPPYNFLPGLIGATA
jgi:hypothetical protein